MTPEDVLAVQLREAHDLAREAGMELDELIIQPYTDFLLGKQRFTLTSSPSNSFQSSLGLPGLVRALRMSNEPS